jgi:hypothetical protein
MLKPKKKKFKTPLARGGFAIISVNQAICKFGRDILGNPYPAKCVSILLCIMFGQLLITNALRPMIFGNTDFKAITATHIAYAYGYNHFYIAQIGKWKFVKNFLFKAVKELNRFQSRFVTHSYTP